MDTGDDDVFGDGTVRILRAPGHTPGHQVLMLTLARAGTVILSGDLYHMREDYVQARCRRSIRAALKRWPRSTIRNRQARLVIQHAHEDFAALPKFPACLD